MAATVVSSQKHDDGNGGGGEYDFHQWYRSHEDEMHKWEKSLEGKKIACSYHDKFAYSGLQEITEFFWCYDEQKYCIQLRLGGVIILHGWTDDDDQKIARSEMWYTMRRFNPEWNYAIIHDEKSEVIDFNAFPWSIFSETRLKKTSTSIVDPYDFRTMKAELPLEHVTLQNMPLEVAAPAKIETPPSPRFGCCGPTGPAGPIGVCYKSQ